MSHLLRIILMIVSVLVVIYILLVIRKSKLDVDDAIYWLIFSILLLVLGIFPGIAEWAAHLMGIVDASNFVFFFMIFMVFIKLFYVSIDLCIQKQRFMRLAQRLALLNKENRDEEQEKASKQEDTEKEYSEV